MRRMRLLSCATLLALFAGCAQPIVGTWTADKSAAEAKNPIARATFCSDRTFTAEAEYGAGVSHAVSGHYTLSGGKLKLDMEGMTREYDCNVKGDVLTMTHEGKQARMNRLQPRSGKSN